jgi:hypothetical protein
MKASGNDAGIVSAGVSACAQILSARFGGGPSKRDGPTRHFVAHEKAAPEGGLERGAARAGVQRRSVMT